MMFGHAWQQVSIPDLPGVDLSSAPVVALLREPVWQAASPICMWDLSVKSVEVREGGVTATPDLTGTAEGYTLPEELKEQLQTVPLPAGVWEALRTHVRG